MPPTPTLSLPTLELELQVEPLSTLALHLLQACLLAPPPRLSRIPMACSNHTLICMVQEGELH